jgi:hypothetical protein
VRRSEDPFAVSDQAFGLRSPFLAARRIAEPAHPRLSVLKGCFVLRPLEPRPVRDELLEGCRGAEVISGLTAGPGEVLTSVKDAEIVRTKERDEIVRDGGRLELSLVGPTGYSQQPGQVSAVMHRELIRNSEEGARRLGQPRHPLRRLVGINLAEPVERLMVHVE